jgi:hypothetical protein
MRRLDLLIVDLIFQRLSGMLGRRLTCFMVALFFLFAAYACFTIAGIWLMVMLYPASPLAGALTVALYCVLLYGYYKDSRKIMTATLVPARLGNPLRYNFVNRLIRGSELLILLYFRVWTIFPGRLALASLVCWVLGLYFGACQPDDFDFVERPL